MLFALQLTKRELVEWCRVVYRFYRFPRFLLADMAFTLLYFFCNPYRLCGNYFRRRGVKDQFYGETPVTTWDIMARQLSLTAADTLVDLGCGRGRGVLFLGAVWRCRVIGVDCIETFVFCARKIGRWCRIDQAQWWHGDLMDADLSEATVVYLFGTTLPDAVIRQWVEKLEALRDGARVITVSYSLLEYGGEHCLDLQDTWKLPYAWGEAEVFVHIRRPRADTDDCRTDDCGND